MLTDEQIATAFKANNNLRDFVDAIESAACAERDKRIVELEERNRDLYEDVQRFKEHALNEKAARLELERQLEEARKDALEEAAKVCEGIADSNKWSDAATAAAAIRALKGAKE